MARKVSIRQNRGGSGGSGGNAVSKKPRKNKAVVNMGHGIMPKVIHISWGQFNFLTDKSLVRGFSNLSISAACETENTESGDGEKYTTLKNKGGWEISITALFDARLGEKDVQNESLLLCEAAARGGQAYFYTRGQKLMPTMFMATSGKIQNIQMTPKGEWFASEVQMTFKQCSKLGGGTGSDGSGGSGGSDGGGGGGGNGTKYTVQIPGMSILTVYANSVLEAIRQACGSNYTGQVFVNNKLYNVANGSIVGNRDGTQGGQDPSGSENTPSSNQDPDGDAPANDPGDAADDSQGTSLWAQQQNRLQQQEQRWQRQQQTS